MLAGHQSSHPTETIVIHLTETIKTLKKLCCRCRVIAVTVVVPVVIARLMLTERYETVHDVTNTV